MFVIEIVSNEEEKSSVWSSSCHDLHAINLTDIDKVKFNVGILRVELTFQFLGGFVVDL